MEKLTQADSVRAKWLRAFETITAPTWAFWVLIKWSSKLVIELKTFRCGYLTVIWSKKNPSLTGSSYGPLRYLSVSKALHEYFERAEAQSSLVQPNYGKAALGKAASTFGSLAVSRAVAELFERDALANAFATKQYESRLSVALLDRAQQHELSKNATDISLFKLRSHVGVVVLAVLTGKKSGQSHHTGITHSIAAPVTVGGMGCALRTSVGEAVSAAVNEALMILLDREGSHFIKFDSNDILNWLFSENSVTYPPQAPYFDVKIDVQKTKRHGLTVAWALSDSLSGMTSKNVIINESSHQALFPGCKIHPRYVEIPFFTKLEQSCEEN